MRAFTTTVSAAVEDWPCVGTPAPIKQANASERIHCFGRSWKFAGFDNDHSPRIRCSSATFLKGWRCVYPQYPGFRAAGVEPTMRRCAFKIETVARLEPVLHFRHRNMQFSPQDEQKLFAVVGVGFTAAGARGNTKQMRFHHGVPPCQ